MSEIEIEAYYKRQAKDLTNLLFDKNFLNSELDRDSIGWLENYIGYLIQSHCKMSAKCAVLTARLKER